MAELRLVWGLSMDAQGHKVPEGLHIVRGDVSDQMD